MREKILWIIWGKLSGSVRIIDRVINIDKDKSDKIEENTIKQVVKYWNGIYLKKLNRGYTLMKKYKKDKNSEMAQHLREKFGPFEWELEESDSDISTESEDATESEGIDENNLLSFTLVLFID